MGNGIENKVLRFVREHEGLDFYAAINEFNSMVVEGTEVKVTGVRELFSEKTLTIQSFAQEAVRGIIDRTLSPDLREQVSSQARSRWETDLLWRAYVEARELYEEDVKERLGLGEGS